jgi:hypothetical protein
MPQHWLCYILPVLMEIFAETDAKGKEHHQLPPFKTVSENLRTAEAKGKFGLSRWDWLGEISIKPMMRS